MVYLQNQNFISQGNTITYKNLYYKKLYFGYFYIFKYLIQIYISKKGRKNQTNNLIKVFILAIIALINIKYMILIMAKLLL